MKLLIIQPWLCAIGHPAQSLNNLASAIGKDERVHYLVSHDIEASEFFLSSIKSLNMWGEVKSFMTTTQSGRLNTVKALLTLWCMRLSGNHYQRIFFFDESLFELALLWPLFSLGLSIERIGVLHLFGPNLGMRRRDSWARFVIGRFLKRHEVRFYLRTEELATAWQEAFNTVPTQQIRHLPSLEIPDDVLKQYPKRSSDTLAFGIIGQIRIGKGIEWLVPVFQSNADLGTLTVAGEFNTPQTCEQLSVLKGFDGFINCFMSESDMLKRAAGQDYLLMLYDVWDKRMESAVLYLAARVNRPVVVYGDSWCGRMVREFGCGVLASVGREETVDLLRRIPRPGSSEYAMLSEGMAKFRQAHSVNSLRGRVIQELLG